MEENLTKKLKTVEEHKNDAKRYNTHILKNQINLYFDFSKMEKKKKKKCKENKKKTQIISIN